MFDIQDYLSLEGFDPYAAWLAELADRQARARVLVRVLRMAAGNLGDCKPLHGGVWELRIDYGPGYRVYYAQSGKPSDSVACGWRQAKATGGHCNGD